MKTLVSITKFKKELCSLSTKELQKRYPNTFGGEYFGNRGGNIAVLIGKYAILLEQCPIPELFVPLKNGRLVLKPIRFRSIPGIDEKQLSYPSLETDYEDDMRKFSQANEEVIFKGCEVALVPQDEDKVVETIIFRKLDFCLFWKRDGIWHIPNVKNKLYHLVDLKIGVEEDKINRILDS